LRLLTASLELFFKLLYNQLAWIYDWVAAIVSVGRWNDWVSAVIPDLGGPRILELGHGPGHLQVSLARCKSLVYGIDTSQQMGRLAYHRLSKSGFSPNLVSGFGEDLPFAAGGFDQVVATFPSGYIFEETTLAGILRVLAPGGKLVILPLAWINPGGFLDRMAARLFRITGQSPEWNMNLAQVFLTAGFQIQIDRRHLASSDVLIIIATKPS